MKAVIVLFFALLFSKQDLQKNLEGKARTHIKNSIDDPSGFEVVEFGKYSKLFTSYEMTDIFKDRIELLKEAVKYAKSEEDPLLKEGWIKLGESVIEELDSLHKAFIPKHIGWKIPIKYRAKNYFGMLKLNQDTVYFSKDQKIIQKDTITVILSKPSPIKD